jgi:class 3 adenylate cyclase
MGAVNNYSYGVEKSSERIDKILNQNGNVFEERSYLPNSSDLTYTNGFYVNVGALFVDIRDSSKLTKNHKRPTLAKLYRAYISEVVAILNSYERCNHINIVGDCVSAIFNGTKSSVCNDLGNASAKINALIYILNYKLEKNNIVPIKIGIGLDYGRSLMIKAGHRGSGVNDIVWMGDVVNKAAKLCNMANKDGNEPILMTTSVYDSINWGNKTELLDEVLFEDCYGGNYFDKAMCDWFKENCR